MYSSRQTTVGSSSPSAGKLIFKMFISVRLCLNFNYYTHYYHCNKLAYHSIVSPTNPTPPDSLTSDDSSYMSARDSSITSTSTARVRFSPITLLDLPSQGQHQDSTVPLRASSSRRSSSVTEFIS